MSVLGRDLHGRAQCSSNVHCRYCFAAADNRVCRLELGAASSRIAVVKTFGPRLTMIGLGCHLVLENLARMPPKHVFASEATASVS